MALSIRVTGLQQAVKELRQLPELLRESAKQAVDATVEHVRLEAIRRTSQRYNLSEATLSHYVYPRRASVTADGARGSVELQIKAVPLTEFGAKVVMRPVTLTGRTGTRYQRTLPSVEVALYRNQRPRRLPGAFPLRQRSDGSVFASESVRRRIGKDRGKLTGFRYYTFPKRITQKLVSELQREGGKQLRVSLRIAYRKAFRGQQVLRLND